MTEGVLGCIRIFKQAVAGIWKPEEISLLERLLANKATVPRNNPQNIFFQDIAFANENIARIKVLLVADNFVPEVFEVCEGRLPDISRQEEKRSRTIIIEKSTSHTVGFEAFFADTPNYRYLGRTRKEAIGTLIEHSLGLLNLEIEWSSNSAQNYVDALKGE
jgi:hypothetical protein